MSGPRDKYPDWLPYLHFGYLPSPAPELPFQLPQFQEKLPNNLPAAAARAGEVLSDVVHKNIVTGRMHSIPLSGGLDSRALLAAAMEAGVDVQTITFGTPGTLDYEYGNQVALMAGCRHQRLNLEHHLPDTAALVEAVRAGGGWTYTFDAYFNRLLTSQLGEEPLVLHGYLGDPVAGSHYQPGLENEQAARIAFIKSQKFGRQSWLMPEGADPSEWLADSKQIPKVKGLTWYERLDISIRQNDAIRPIVIDPRANARTPFANPNWLGLMFSAPAEWRQGCRLYEAALVHRWPELFSLPTKNHYGLGLNVSKYRRESYHFFRKVKGRLYRHIGLASQGRQSLLNYIDFRRAFMELGPMQELARENLADLTARGVVPWLQPQNMLTEHIDGKANYERELQVLIGLEINLKVLCA